MATENIKIIISAEDEATKKIQEVSQSLLQLQDSFKDFKFPALNTSEFKKSLLDVENSMKNANLKIPKIDASGLDQGGKQIKNLSINLKSLEGVDLTNLNAQVSKLDLSGFDQVKVNVKGLAKDLDATKAPDLNLEKEKTAIQELTQVWQAYKLRIKEVQDIVRGWQKDIKIFDKMQIPDVAKNVFSFTSLDAAVKKAGISQKDFAVWQRRNFFTMNDGVQLTNELTKETMSYGKAAAKAKMDSRRFKMEWLSVMFAGMQLERTFGGMLQPVMELLGWFDIWGAILQAVLLPVLLPFTDILISIFEWINGLTDEQKRWIGSFIVAIAVIGTLMAALGMFMLFVNQLTQLIDNIIPEEALNNLELFGFSLGELPGTLLNSLIALLGFGGTVTGVAGLINLLTGGLFNLTGAGEETGDIFGGLDGIFGGIGDIIKKLIPGLENVDGLFSGLGEKGGDFASVGMNILTSIVEGLISGIGEFITNVSSTLLKAVDQIVLSLPTMVETGATIITNIIKGIVDNMGLIIDSTTTIIVSILNAIISAVPELIEAGKNIFNALVEGITNNISPTIEVIISFLDSIISGLSKLLPELLIAGEKILTALVDGIIKNIKLIEDISLKIIDFIINFLDNNFDKLLNAGMEILLKIIDGISSRLDKIVDVVLKIILSITNTIINNLPKIIDLGSRIIVKLVEGITQNVPMLVEAVVKGVFAILDWVKNNPLKMVEIGIQIATAIVKGIVKGIISLGDSLWEAILKSIGNKMGSDLSFGGFQFGGMVPETGPYILHRGEEVIPANQVGSSASVIYFTPTANINANISNSYDVRELADELNTYWAQDFQRMMRSRGSI